MGLPCEVKPHPVTGLYNGKFGIWLFLASEVMLFGALFSSYVLLRVGADYWPHGYTVLNVPLATLNTMVLITSSVTMVLAWAQLKLNNLGKARIYLLATVALAFGFLIIKGFEYGPKFNHFQIWFKDGRETIEGHDLTDHGDYFTIVKSEPAFGSKDHPVIVGQKAGQLEGTNGGHGSNGQDTHAGGEITEHTGGHPTTRLHAAAQQLPGHLLDDDQPARPARDRRDHRDRLSRRTGHRAVEEEQGAFHEPGRMRRPLLALCRPRVDFPVSLAVPFVTV
jgi:hypothetical protein